MLCYHTQIVWLCSSRRFFVNIRLWLHLAARQGTSPRVGEKQCDSKAGLAWVEGGGGSGDEGGWGVIRTGETLA